MQKQRTVTSSGGFCAPALESQNSSLRTYFPSHPVSYFGGTGTCVYKPNNRHELRHFEDLIHSWLGSATQEETEDYNDHRANDVYLTAMMFLSTSGGR